MFIYILDINIYIYTETINRAFLLFAIIMIFLIEK